MLTFPFGIEHWALGIKTARLRLRAHRSLGSRAHRVRDDAFHSGVSDMFNGIVRPGSTLTSVR
jgi:hypothetical protein